MTVAITLFALFFQFWIAWTAGGAPAVVACLLSAVIGAFGMMAILTNDRPPR